jgi:hypothetical protein
MDLISDSGRYGNAPLVFRLNESSSPLPGSGEVVVQVQFQEAAAILSMDIYHPAQLKST